MASYSPIQSPHRDPFEQIDGLYRCAEALLSSSTLSTTATQDNLPGAGRTVGLGISFLGKHVESLGRRVADKRRASKSSAQTLDFYQHTSARQSSSSVSSTATADDLPGAGRTLGLLISFLGKRIEDVGGTFMHKRGHGPLGARRKLLQQFPCIWHPHNDGRMTNGDRCDFCALSLSNKKPLDIGKVKNICSTLLKHSRSYSFENQELAIEAIIDFAVDYNGVREALIHLNGPDMLAQIELQAEREKECDYLLARSRKALFCLVESEVNVRARRLHILTLPPTTWPVPGNVRKEIAQHQEQDFAAMFDYTCRNPEFIFLVMRHLRRWEDDIIQDRLYGDLLVLLRRYILYIVEQAADFLEWYRIIPIVRDIINEYSCRRNYISGEEKLLRREELTRICFT